MRKRDRQGGWVLWWCSCLALCLLPAQRAAAESAPGDGLYGRWSSPWTLEAGLGGALVWDDGRRRGALLVEAGARYLAAAGPRLTYAYLPHGEDSLALGLELRPLVPVLFLRNLSTGRAFIDLSLQSLAFELGPSWLPGSGGVGWFTGASLTLPLWHRPRGNLGLRLGARRLWARSRFAAGPDAGLGRWMASLRLVGAWRPAGRRL